jgi:glycosyltransferase involved in cell wall biosynthesis
LRVAVDARLVTYQPAGIGNYVLSLLASLRELVRPDQIDVLVSRKDRNIAAQVAPLPTRNLWTPPHHRFEQLVLPFEVVRLDADVYHAPDFVPPFLRRFPAVVTVHDLAFLRMPELLTPESRRYYGQVGPAARNADRIIAVSECTRRDLVDLVGAPSKRIEVVYEAADARYRPLGEPEVDARGDVPDEYLLFVGTREPRKNLARLLEAYAALVARAPAAPPLLVAGRRGWLADDLEARADGLGLGERVRWLGGVTPDELVRLYNLATALVFPSLYEGFGLPALEAMACGLPVVASTGGSLPEVVGEAGLLVDPFDVDGLSRAMERVWREPGLRDDLRGRGFARAAEFSWRRAAEETLDVYRRAA